MPNAHVQFQNSAAPCHHKSNSKSHDTTVSKV
jgi:hypothetical protein